MTGQKAAIARLGWLRDQSGAAAVEFALVVLLLVTFIFGAIDLSRMGWDWNRAATATQAGARFAVVNDMVAAELQNFDALGLLNEDGTRVLAPGDDVDSVEINGGEPVVCTATGCSEGFTKIDDAFDRIVARMQRVHPGIQPENVVVEYTHVGLGFAGNPFGSDISPLVTVSLQDMEFQFVTPGLYGIVGGIALPPFLTTLSGEDYATGS